MHRRHTHQVLDDLKIIEHISWELYLFHGPILEPMCENSSGYLDDGEAPISIYPKPGTASFQYYWNYSVMSDVKPLYSVLNYATSR